MAFFNHECFTIVKIVTKIFVSILSGYFVLPVVVVEAIDKLVRIV